MSRSIIKAQSTAEQSMMGFAIPTTSRCHMNSCVVFQQD